MKKLLAGISVTTLLAIAPALAQQQSAPSTQPPAAQPSQSAPSAKSPEPSMKAPEASKSEASKSSDQAGKSATATPSASTSGFRASNLLNANIKNSANETVGDISDLLIDKSGKVTSVIVGVGGFLGIGERKVALSFDQLQISTDANGRPTIMANVTKESLKSVPEWRDPNTPAR